MTLIPQHGYKNIKNIFFFAVLILLTCNIKAQGVFFSKEYADSRWKADSLFKIKEYGKAGLLYSHSAKMNVQKRFKKICYYNASFCYRYLESKKKAVNNFYKAVKCGLHYSSLQQIDSDTSLYYFEKHKKWKSIKKKLIANTLPYLNINSELKRKLLDLYKRDQFYRVLPSEYKDSLTREYGANKIDSLLFILSSKQDEDNRIELKNILKEYRWPGLKLVGEDGDQAAWLVVQHSDQDLDFQNKCLSIIEDAIINENTGLKNYPYLIDRCLINQKKSQIFGTQFLQIYDMNGKAVKLVTKPIQDHKNVDKLRNCFGLETVNEYLDFASKRYGIINK